MLPLNIYYGSQTGTAAKFSKILADEGASHGFITNVVDLIDVKTEKDLIDLKVGIFCMANQGEGDPTDNAKAFFQWI